MDELSKDSAMALSIIDQIESAMAAGEDGAEEQARQLIQSSMSEPNGTLFVLQGVKAMLTAMQSETTPASFDEKFEIRHVWTLLNQHATNEHREVFNEFRLSLYVDADRLQDWVRIVALVTDREIPKAMADLMDRVCSVPVLQE